MTLPIFVINLDRRPDRLQAMAAHLDRIGLEWERISAVDGQLLSESGSKIRLRSPGAEGCRASHCKALREFLATPHPAALILEDDVEVASDMPYLLESVDWWPRGANLLKLNTGARRPTLGPRVGETPSGRCLHRLYAGHHGSYGYLVNRKAAQVFLAACESSRLCTDQMLFEFKRSPVARQLKPLQIAPAAVRHPDGNESDCGLESLGKMVRLGQKLQGGYGSRLAFFGSCMLGRIKKQPNPYADIPQVKP